MLGEREFMNHTRTAKVYSGPHADRGELSKADSSKTDSAQAESAVASGGLSVPPEHAWLTVVEVIGGYWELSRVASRAASSVTCVRLSALPLKPRAAPLGLLTSCAILAEKCGLGTASNGRRVWERSI
jgi:hypothetical protein